MDQEQIKKAALSAADRIHAYLVKTGAIADSPLAIAGFAEIIIQEFTSIQPEDPAGYWTAAIQAERRRSQDNLRLAADRATEIGELRIELKEMAAQLAGAQAALDAALVRKVDITLAEAGRLGEWIGGHDEN